MMLRTHMEDENQRGVKLSLSSTDVLNTHITHIYMMMSVINYQLWEKQHVSLVPSALHFPQYMAHPVISGSF